MDFPDLALNLDGTHVMITGAGGYIGRVCVAAFPRAGAYVTALDLNISILATLGKHSNLFTTQADITKENEMELAFTTARAKYGPVACCVALASLDLSVLKRNPGLADIEMEQVQRTLQVNVTGTFLTARTWLRHVREFVPRSTSNVSLIIVGSESGHFGERGNPDYAAGKSAVQYGLLQSLKADVPRIFPGARVNAIAPGPVDTERFQRECQENPDQLWLDAQVTTATGKPVPPSAVAKGILFLASDSWSGSIMGQTLNVDGGKHGKLMWQRGEVEN